MRPELRIEHINIAPDYSGSEQVRAAVLKALLYFDIFNYPLTDGEIAGFCSVKPEGLLQIQKILKELCDKLIIYRFEDYYTLKNDAGLIGRRKKGNQAAAEVMDKAGNRSRKIHRFPFVRSVNISGSLSKNYFDEQADLDFFIITAPNRVWTTRFLLTVYKKIFLLNSRKYFCINYYVDTEILTIPDKNIFTATEIITLKNQTGESVYKDFIGANQWVLEMYPNFDPDYTFLQEARDGGLKRMTEKMLSGRLGNVMESLAFRITALFLRRKYAHLPADAFNINLRAGKHASKHHPQGFQFRVLSAFEQKCREFEAKHAIELSNG